LSKKIFLLISLILFINHVFAQSTIVPYEFFFNQNIERELAKKNRKEFTSTKPFAFSNEKIKSINDSIGFSCLFDTTAHLFEQKLFRQDVIKINKEDFTLSINPMFNFSLGRDKKENNQRLLQNTRGLWVKGTIGKKFYFESQFLENQVTAPLYVREFVKTYKVYPGLGRTKVFKDIGADFAISSANFLFAPNKNVSIMAGTGKHFYGFGYRSLLLSDNSFNYPYVKAIYSRKWFRYEAMWSSLMNIYQGEIAFSVFSEPAFRKKTAAFQYLVLMPFNFLELGLFNGIIYRPVSKAHPYFNFNILNPVPFFNVANQGLSSVNNAIAGLNLRLKLTSSISIYGQYMIDNMAANDNLFKKSGMQIGTRYFDIAGIKNLNFLLEYNSVSPYSYTTKSSQQNYIHYNQSLTHPWGANFKEIVGIVSYNYKGVFITAKVNTGQIGIDSTGGTFGQNILLSDVSGRNRTINSFLQGRKTKLEIIDIKAGYIINPAYNFQVFVGFFNRRWINDNQEKYSNFFSFGLRTNIYNNYLDF
jgi:hypothetical protein